MNRPQAYFSQLPSVLGVLAVMLLVIASGLTACGMNTDSSETASNGDSFSATLTSASSSADASLPPALATDIAKNTQVISYGYHIATIVSLTHAPTRTVGVPVYPTPTLEIGVLGGCSNTNSMDFQCYNAWRGYLDNNLLEVRVGREGSDGDPMQGEIIIFSAHRATTYPAPGKTGALDIASIKGELLMVTAINSPTHQTFVFNLRSHQWTSATR